MFYCGIFDEHLKRFSGGVGFSAQVFLCDLVSNAFMLQHFASPHGSVLVSQRLDGVGLTRVLSW